MDVLCEWVGGWSEQIVKVMLMLRGCAVVAYCSLADVNASKHHPRPQQQIETRNSTKTLLCDVAEKETEERPTLEMSQKKSQAHHAAAVCGRMCG